MSRSPQAFRSTTARHPLTIGFVIVAAAVSVLLVIIYKPFWRPLLWAAALAILVYPLHRRFVRAIGGRVTLGAIVSTIVALAVLVVPSAFIVNQLVIEARHLWPLLSESMGENVFAQLSNWVETTPLRNFIHQALQVPVEQGAAGLEERFRGSIEALGAEIVPGLRGVTVGAPGALLQAGITIVAFFFFLRQGPRWAVRLRENLPLEREHADALVDTAARTVNAVFRGVILTGLTQAVLATLGYFVVGAPVPLLLGFLTFVTSLLPFVGAGLVWGLTAIGLYLSGSVGSAIALTLWGGLVVSLIDNFLKPYLIGKDIRLPVLWLFLAIVGGLKTFGILGLLVGPGALALFLACTRILAQERARRTAAGRLRGPSDEPLLGLGEPYTEPAIEAPRTVTRESGPRAGGPARRRQRS